MLWLLTDCLMKKLMPNEIGSERYEVCRYGCELWLYTVVSTAGLLLAGLLMNAFAETAVMIGIFYLCQSNGGGYHASSHIACFLTMLAGLVCGLLLINVPFGTVIYGCLAAVSAVVLLAIPLQLHRNKSYLQANAQKLRWRSRLVTILIVAFLIVAGSMGWDKLFCSGCIAFVMSAISRVYAKLFPSRI